MMATVFNLIQVQTYPLSHKSYKIEFTGQCKKMHISYLLCYRYRSACPILNSHIIYLCIFKAQKNCPQTFTVIGAAIKNLREVRMDYWPQFRCKAKSHLGNPDWEVSNTKQLINSSSDQRRKHLCPLCRWLLWITKMPLLCLVSELERQGEK